MMILFQFEGSSIYREKGFRILRSDMKVKLEESEEDFLGVT